MASTTSPPRALNGDAPRVLIIDDDHNLAASMKESLERPAAKEAIALRA